MRVEDILAPKQLLDYTKENPIEPGGLEALFPSETVYGFDADWVKGANNKEVVAQFYAFDTPTEIGQRDTFEQGKVSLYLIKEKMKLDERELMRLHHPRSDAEAMQVVSKIYNDVERIRQRIENRIELMRYQAITTGQIEIKGNGLDQIIDFGIPTNHKGNLDWSDPNHDVFTDIFTISDMMFEETGFRPEHILCSRKTLWDVVRNNTVRETILGTEYKKLITPGELNAELQRFGLPTLSIDEKTYATEKVVKKKRVLTQQRFMPEDAIIFLPGGTLGHTLRGMVPESEIAGYTGALVEQAGSTVLTHYQEVDPVAQYVKGSATAMVTFPYAEQIYIGKNAK